MLTLQGISDTDWFQFVQLLSTCQRQVRLAMTSYRPSLPELEHEMMLGNMSFVVYLSPNLKPLK